VTDRHPLLDPALRRSVEAATSSHLGSEWTSTGFRDLNDRASHPAGIFCGEQLSVFVKASFANDGDEVFRAELDGLVLLRKRAGVITPVSVGPGLVQIAGGWLLLYEAITERSTQVRTTDDWRAIGRSLAVIHQVHNREFGLRDFNGFFGPLPQDNAPVSSNRWADFYGQRRVMPLLRAAVDSGQLPLDLPSDVEGVVRRLLELAGPEPRPTLLHGDAQQNNFVSSDSGAVVIDVAPYFGHPELDLALLNFFRPVPDLVFDAYQEVLPIDPGFAERRELWRIFGYLAGIAVEEGSALGRLWLSRLSEAVRLYR
jgi:protein-ribulosamine 3-kinase